MKYFWFLSIGISVVLSFIFTGCSPSNTEKKQVTSAPTSAPRPTAVPTQLPTPTPTPLPELSYFEENFPIFKAAHQSSLSQITTKLTDDYALSLPQKKVGDQVDVLLDSGQSLQGHIKSFASDSLEIDTFSGDKTLMFVDLDAVMRFMIDEGFRSKIIKLEAAYLAYNQSIRSYDEIAFELELNLDEETLMTLGHTPTLLAYGKKQKDAGQDRVAFFLYGTLAKNNNYEAKRELALLYFTGRGSVKNPALGRKLLQEAADAGDAQAKVYLAEYDAGVERQRLEEEKIISDRKQAIKNEEARKRAQNAPTPAPHSTIRRAQYGEMAVERKVYDRPTKINGVKTGSGDQIYRESRSRKYFYMKDQERNYISDSMFKHYKIVSGK